MRSKIVTQSNLFFLVIFCQMIFSGVVLAGEEVIYKELPIYAECDPSEENHTESTGFDLPEDGFRLLSGFKESFCENFN